MALLSRQTYTYEIIDDQSPTMLGNFVGNWAHENPTGLGLINNTCSGTGTPGASFSYTFSGTQVILYGYSPNASTVGYPTADYLIDGVAFSPKPFLDPSGLVYLSAPNLTDGTHLLNVTVKTASNAVWYILDALYIVPSVGSTNSGVETILAAPSPTSTVIVVAPQSTPVGAIVGGVVGGVAGIAILAIAAWYFLSRRSRGGPAYYPEKPDAGGVLTGEGHLEPFSATAGSTPPSSAGFWVPGPHPVHSDGGSNRPLSPLYRQSVFSSYPPQHDQPGLSEAGLTYLSGTSAQPRTGKAALMSQQFENVQQPVQYQDSGVRFTEDVEQEAGSSRLPSEVPPTYTSN